LGTVRKMAVTPARMEERIDVFMVPD
jgi:hypothetical protein